MSKETSSRLAGGPIKQELEAAEKVAEALVDLSDGAKRRVVNWAIEVFGLNQQPSKHPLDR